MLRNIGAVILGLVVGAAANMAIVMLNSMVLFPMPEGLDMSDPEQFAAYAAGLPALAWVMAILAHLAQAGLGGWVAARVGSSRPVLLALIVGGLTLLGGIMSFVSMQPPAWMAVEFPLYLVVAWGAGSLEARRRAAS